MSDDDLDRDAGDQSDQWNRQAPIGETLRRCQSDIGAERPHPAQAQADRHQNDEPPPPAPTYFTLRQFHPRIPTSDLGDITSHTPIWVPLIFLYVATQTLRATRERSAGLPRLMAIPLLFIIWGI